MASRLRPRVYKDAWDCCWVAELDRGDWVDSTDFDAWDKAIDHALWLGWCANGRA